MRSRSWAPAAVAAAVMAMLATASAPASARCKDCTFNGKPVNLYHGGALRGKSGTVRCVDHTGRVCREETIVDGKKSGPVRYYRDGQLALVEHFRKDRRHGIKREYGADGKLRWESRYADGKKIEGRAFHPSGKTRSVTYSRRDGFGDGISASFNEDGKLTALSCRQEVGPAYLRRLCGYGGQPSQVVLHFENGEERKRMTLRDGKPEGKVEVRRRDGKLARVEQGAGKDGPFSRFHDNGKPKQKGRRKGGRLHGKLTEYHKSGKLQREARYRDGQLLAEKTYYLNGQPESEVDYETPTRRHVRRFHDTGKLAEVGVYVKAGPYHWSWWVQDGPFTYYDEDGAKRATVGYQRGRRHGVEQRYDGKGRLRTVNTWEAGRLKSYKSYDEKGKLLATEAYEADGSRKSRGK